MSVCRTTNNNTKIKSQNYIQKFVIFLFHNFYIRFFVRIFSIEKSNSQIEIE